MELKRFKDIIAIKSYDSSTQSDTIVGFHASNLELAEMSLESYNEMQSIDTKDGSIPESKMPIDIDAFRALEGWNSEVNSDAKSGKIEYGIRSLTLNVNQICNLKCTYCAAGGDGTYGEPSTQISIEKTLPQLKYFLTSLKPKSKFYITFVGGEPLLHPEAIKTIYDYVNTESIKLNVQPIFTIVTNGTLFTDNTLNIVRSMKVGITISLDGVKEANDVVRPAKSGQSSTDMTLKGLRELKKNKGEILSIGLASVYSDKNTELVTNYLFFKELDLDWMEFNFAYSEKSSSLQAKFISQMNKVAEIAWNCGGEAELRKIRLFDHYFKMIDHQQKIENHCGAGKSYLMVDAKNKLYPCPWMVGERDEVVGVYEQLNHEKLSKYSKPLIELNNCNTCWARYLCGGGCMYIHKQHTGDKHTKDNLFCDRTRSLILTALLYYKRARC